jgi:hypothetical protein
MVHAVNSKKGHYYIPTNLFKQGVVERMKWRIARSSKLHVVHLCNTVVKDARTCWLTKQTSGLQMGWAPLMGWSKIVTPVEVRQETCKHVGISAEGKGRPFAN